VTESCAAEHALHESAPADPRGRSPMPRSRDRRLRTRARLSDFWSHSAPACRGDSIESAYAGLFRGDGVDSRRCSSTILTQVIVRHVLATRPTDRGARPARFFRTQRSPCVTRRRHGQPTNDGRRAGADIGFRHAGRAPGTEQGTSAHGELRRSRRRVGRAILGSRRAIRFRDQPDRDRPAAYGVDASVGKVDRAFPGDRRDDPSATANRDATGFWHVGLDAEASALLNDLYNAPTVDEDRMKRLLCLFQLDVRRSRGHAARAGRTPGLPGDGDGRRRTSPSSKPQTVAEPSAPRKRMT